MTVLSGGLASGGTANATSVIGTLINVYGSATRQAGSLELRGTADNPAVSYNATVFAANQYVGIEDGDELRYGVAYDTILSGGILTVGGLTGAASGTIILQDGMQQLDAGGVTADTVVSSGGAQIINGGGTATGTIVSAGGVQHVHGFAGTGEIGIAKNTTIESGGTQLVRFLSVAVQ